MDAFGNNEVPLYSLTKNDGIVPPKPEVAEITPNQDDAQVSIASKQDEAEVAKTEN